MNLYFFLEDLYAGGKTKNYQVLEEFKSSAQLSAAVKDAIQEFIGAEMPLHHREALQEYIRLAHVEFSVEGILKLIVFMRGNLHHFSQKSAQPKGNPLNQFWLETLAFLMISICVKLIPKLLFPEESGKRNRS